MKLYNYRNVWFCKLPHWLVNFTKDDDWRGISLLDVIGKVFACILQQGLQTAAESELAKSQCGFRKGRGCTDMLFCA